MKKNYDDLLYTQVADEISKGQINEGLWLKATVEANGNDLQAKLRYTTLRINQLKEEIYVVNQQRVNDIEQKHVKILNNIGCKVIFNKGGLLTSNKWLVTTKNKQQITIKTLDELVSFAKNQENIFLCEKKLNEKILLCEKKLDDKGYILSKYGRKWCITDYLGNKKIFNSVKDLELFASFEKH